MSLRAKVLSIVIGTLLVYGVVDHAFQRLFVAPRFRALERQAAQEELGRATRFIDAEVADLDDTCRAWSAALAPRALSGEPARAPASAGLVPERFVQDRIDGAYLFGDDGALVWGETRDRADGSPLEAPGLAAAALAAAAPGLRRDRERTPPVDLGVAGVVATVRGPILLAARPVRAPSVDGADAGALVVVRFLDDALRARLNRRTGMEARLLPLPAGSASARLVSALARASSGDRTFVERDGEAFLRLLAVVRDLGGAPAALVRVRFLRSISEEGDAAVRFSLLSTTAVALLLFLVLSGLLQRTVVRPLAQLARHALDVGREGARGARLNLRRDDEIGALALEFDQMMDRLDEQSAALAEANRRLEELAVSDALTGVANRRRFDQALASQWRRCFGDARPLSLVMADVDHFKRYNDHYGHAAGDACLRAVAQLIAGVPRRSDDLVARYGGEEFAVVLPDCDADGARAIAERIRAAIEDAARPHDGSPLGGILTVSLGVATITPHRDATRESLIERADAALYEAKREGRNRVASAPPTGEGPNDSSDRLRRAGEEG